MLHLSDELHSLHNDLSEGVYKHGKYQHFKINDPKPRDIHKATVQDRLLHHAIHRQLYPIFDHAFIADSYSCRKGKGLHLALDRFTALACKVSQNNKKTCWILKCDVKKFFASIDHEILLNLLSERITDQKVLDLLYNIISSFKNETGRGLPLGNLTSQLFANIYLNNLDQYIKHKLKTKFYIRYADDFVILSDNQDDLIRLLPKIEEFLQIDLKLKLHPDKVFIKTLASGIDFLGWIHFPHHRVLRTKTRRRIEQRISQKPNDKRLQSYLGLLQHGNAHKISDQLKNDFWLWS
jgi:retron-type reverse transcriptase